MLFRLPRHHVKLKVPQNKPESSWGRHFPAACQISGSPRAGLFQLRRRGTLHLLFQAVGQSIPEVRMGFHQACDVRQILDALALPPL